MPNQGKIQQEDGHAFSTTDTKIRYRTENSGSPLEHAQVDSNFEILRNVANGLVDDIKSNYDDIRVNQASIASLESRADEFDNITSVNANDIAVNGVKIGENLEKIEALQETTASQGEDITSNADGIATNATAILNLDTKTTDNHTAVEARVTNNETAIATLQGSDSTNTENITELQNNLSVTTAGAIANENNITTLGELLDATITDLQTFFGDSDLLLEGIETRLDSTDARLNKFFNTTDNSDGLTVPSITSAIDQAALAVVDNANEINTLQGIVTGHAGLLLPQGDDGNHFDRFAKIEKAITDLQTHASLINASLANTNNSVQQVVDTVAGTTGGYHSGNYEVASGTGTKNTTVNMSTYNVPDSAKWGYFGHITQVTTGRTIEPMCFLILASPMGRWFSIITLINLSMAGFSSWHRL